MISREQYYIDLLKPEYNICLVAGSALSRLVKNSTRLKLRNVWLHRILTKSGDKDSTLREFIINSIQEKLNQSRLNFNRLYKEFDKIKLLRKKKLEHIILVFILLLVQYLHKLF